MNTGQADESEVLEAEVEAQRMRMSARMQENTLRENAVACGGLSGSRKCNGHGGGDLEKIGRNWNEEQVVEAISKESPAVRIAEAAEGRAQSVSGTSQARSDSGRAVTRRAGIQPRNARKRALRERLGRNCGSGRRDSVLQPQIKGMRRRPEPTSMRAGQEKKRISLTLRERAASAVRPVRKCAVDGDGISGRDIAAREEGIWIDGGQVRQMLASYPRVLDAQRKLYELQIEYIAALESVWTNASRFSYLLTDGLEAPARPSEVDRPVRETNVPDAGTDDVAPRTRRKPLGMIAARLAAALRIECETLVRR